MPDRWMFLAIGVLGLVSYAMRAGGFLAAAWIREESVFARFLRLAPGNLFVAFVVAGCFSGGLPSVVGCAAALLAMIFTGRAWAALSAGFGAAAVTAALAGF